MKKFLKIYILFNIFLIDRFIWFFIGILPNKIIIDFLRKKIKINFFYLKKNNFQNKIRIFLAYALKSNIICWPKFSSCLSKSLTGKYLLNIFGIESKLYLGMTNDSNGRKIPHAWLVDFEYGFHYTVEYKEKESNILLYF